NQRCGFCTYRRARDRDDHDPHGALEELRGAESVVLSGGEPTLRRDLPALVEVTAAMGAAPILETNAALVNDALAARLYAAGLREARVHVPAWGAAYDAVTADPGSFSAMLRGAAALLRAGVTLEANVSVARRDVDYGQLAQQCSTAKDDSGAALFAAIRIVPVLAGTASDGAALDDKGLVSGVEAALDRASLPVRLDPGAFLPPCAFSRPSKLEGAVALNPGSTSRPGYIKVADCEACSLSDRCPGLPKNRSFQARPIASRARRRRLSLVSTKAAQIERELVQRDVYRDEAGVAHPATIVRVHFACNQRCDFCFVSTHLPNGDDERIEDAIRVAGAAGHIVVLSGGEPTLSPRLLDWVRAARESGATHVDLQTNATTIDRAKGRALAQAGVDWAFVSLHAPDAPLSDQITGAPGTFGLTLAGIDALMAASIFVRLNIVLHRSNASRFVEHVRFVAERFPGACLVPSFVAASTDLVPRSLVPRYSEVLGPLHDGLALARELGVDVRGLDSLCGVPLCLVREHAAFETLAEAPPELAAGETFHPPACADCRLRGTCFGVRRSYAALHGVDELTPVRG
ncbi:MAG: radical SAM protein, partial [Myxococcota bacterium]